jgi:hypothetical protein
MTRKALLSLPLLLLPLASCDRDQEAMVPSSTPEEAPAAAAPAPVGPISSRGERVGAAPAGAPVAQGSLNFDVPASWVKEPPTNQMRLGQAAIPGPGGPGELVVFYFGPGSGGSVDANIQRWIDQMEPAPGSNPKPETFETNGYRVTWIDVAGTLKPSSMGMGPSVEVPNARLLGAVVEGNGGPWFFKATGPDATLTAERENFLKMLRSVRPM